MSELPTTPPKKEEQLVAALTKIGSTAPPWANGLVLILGTILAIVTALNVDFGQLINSKMQNDAAQVQVLTQSNTQIITSLNEAIQVQAQQIARLMTDNQNLQAQILELKFQVAALERSCTVLTPTPSIEPAPTAGNPR